MPVVKNVSGTAFVVAEFRAEENRAASPLYRDPVVELFLNDDSREAAARVASGFAPVHSMVKLRTRYLDDTLDSQIRAGVGQVVVLGAGLDTRAVRKQSPGVRYFEIDDPATLEWKQDCYRQHRLAADVKFIPGNYVTDGLMTLLRTNGFDVTVPTFFIWEGNTMYLPAELVKNTVSELTAWVDQFQISCDYMAEAVITKTTGDAGVTRLVENFEAMGAPWHSGISDIEAFAHELGVTLVENVTTGDLHRRYWPDRPVTSPIFDYYSLCTLRS